MRLWNRTFTRGMVLLALIGGLTLVMAPASPVVHADSGPTVSAAWTTKGLGVTGEGFTPGGYVLIQVDGADIPTLGGTLLDTVQATTDTMFTCSPPSGCYGVLAGSIFDNICGLDRSFDHTVSAYDFDTNQWSNKVIVARLIDPGYVFSRTGC